MQKNEASSGKKLNKEFQKNNQLNIDTYPTNKINYRSNIISKDAKTFDPSSTLPVFTMFKGFYNKKFNLTSYKNERENSRSRSRSPERRYEPHKIRGNGISEDALERIHYLGNIFKDSSFQKYYASRPPKRLSKFEEVCEYIINYRKNHSELESAMMAFYFVCHEIKYDSFYYKKNNNVNINNNQNKKTSFNTKNFQRPDLIYRKGKALSLGFTNLFEYILKRMEIKYKHLEGYCKLIPKNVKLNPYTNNLNQTISNNTSNKKIKINDNNAENNKNINFILRIIII